MSSNAVLQRITALEKQAEMLAAERRRFAPFTEIRVDSLCLDKARLIYHPKGIYGVAGKTEALTLGDALACTAENKVVRMIFSPEWCYCLHMTSPDYTEAQKARFTADFRAAGPDEITWICDSPEVIKMIAQLPQSFRYL